MNIYLIFADIQHHPPECEVLLMTKDQHCITEQKCLQDKNCIFKFKFFGKTQTFIYYLINM